MLIDCDVSGRLADCDAAELQSLGDFAHQVGVEQTVQMAGTGHTDMVSQMEAALEATVRDAAVQELAGRFFGGLAADDGQGAIIYVDRKLTVGEAGNG